MAKFSDQFQAFCELAIGLQTSRKADAVLLLLERPTDFKQLEKALPNARLVVAGGMQSALDGAAEANFPAILLNMSDETPVYERLTQALLEGVAMEYFAEGATIVAVYSGFEAGVIDSLSLIKLDEHLGRLTVRDLRQLKTKIPVETIKLVVDLAVEIGREGREGKPVGSLFVVGDHRKTMSYCHPMGFDPVKGYNKAERQLTDVKVREGVKEIAQMDGAFIVSADATVIASAQLISAPNVPELSLPKGMGARHWAAAEITKATSAIAIAISESNGTVRVFQNGEVKLRIEPFRRAMKWKAFDTDSPA
jgi:diadenylate cyclase